MRNFASGISVNPNNTAQANNPVQVTIYNTAVRGCSERLTMITNYPVFVRVNASGCCIEGCSNDGVATETSNSGSAVDCFLEGCKVCAYLYGLYASGAGEQLRAHRQYQRGARRRQRPGGIARQQRLGE
ncbi:MAG: hypothetical protein JO295_04520 [Verrucomicrobia bacterium]|nr:hypothetical protein [Verrucomicrobiota bacterium]